MEYVRKWFVLTVVMAVFFADAGAFGATTRGGRGVVDAGATTGTIKTDGNSVSSGNQPIAVRAASRTRTQPVSTASGANSARVATRTTVKSVAPQSTAQSTTQPVPQQQVGSGVVARAGTKQKAVNMGTKITTATENTNIPEECKTAFDGCMDSFCMIANTSGGRCRCDDRGEELDSVLDQIMKLDMQSKTLAEEGVERLQRGDAVDTIYAMAEDAANKVVADQKKNQKNFLDTESKTKSNKLDLSVFSSGVFDTDDLFDGLDEDVLRSDLSDKKGNALRSAATKMCVSNVPSQCKEHSSMLQLIYAQKIKSDCIAYENDLKQQKMNSENLLKTAQKAVRDAAAEAYESKNKYKTTGECVIAFKQCMLGEDACGSGFSKCVIDPTLVSKNASKPYTIKTSKSITVEITASTYSALEGSRSFCDNVLAQCVDANKNDAVWKQFLVNVAPELKAAEYNAEDESRRDCAKNVVACIKEQAAGEGLQEGSDNWYIFTSNPDNVENFCGGELRKCSAYDESGEKGTMYKAVMSFVDLSLNALRADRCTTTIKKCIQDSCGKDYSECLGFSVADLRRYCPKDVIEADCAGGEASSSGFRIYSFSNDDELYAYVNEVAQGLFLNVDDALQKACRNAVNTAMNTYCGGTTSCSNSGLDFTGIVNTYLEVETSDGEIDPLVCGAQKVSLAGKNISKWIAVDMSNSAGPFVSTYSKENTKIPNTKIDTTVAKLNDSYKTLVGFIENDPDVSKCRNGVSYRDFAGKEQTGSRTANEKKAFTNLTSSTKSVIAQSIYDTFLTQFSARVEELNEDVDDKKQEAKDEADSCKGKYALVLFSKGLDKSKRKSALTALTSDIVWKASTWLESYDDGHYKKNCTIADDKMNEGWATRLECFSNGTPLVKLTSDKQCPTGMTRSPFAGSASWTKIAEALREHFLGVNTEFRCVVPAPKSE